MVVESFIADGAEIAVYVFVNSVLVNTAVCSIYEWFLTEATLEFEVLHPQMVHLPTKNKGKPLLSKT
jgi:hypothetical protein